MVYWLTIFALAKLAVQPHSSASRCGFVHWYNVLVTFFICVHWDIFNAWLVQYISQTAAAQQSTWVYTDNLQL